jgi:hypothetical protein
MERAAGFEPTPCQDGNLVPCRLATPAQELVPGAGVEPAASCVLGKCSSAELTRPFLCLIGGRKLERAMGFEPKPSGFGRRRSIPLSFARVHSSASTFPHSVPAAVRRTPTRTLVVSTYARSALGWNGELEAPARFELATRSLEGSRSQSN